MKPRYFKIVLVMVVVFALLISQGCMRVNFIGAGREDKKEHLKKIPPRGPLDEESRTDTRGNMTIEINFAGITYRGDLAFNVKMHSYSVILGQYPLDKISMLSNDRGIQIQASKWEISLLTDRQVLGTLYFPAKDTSENILLAAGVRNVTLTIEMPIRVPEIVELGGTPKWIFQWKLPSGSEGKKAIERIYWPHGDGDMHVSFPALWRAIRTT